MLLSLARTDNDNTCWHIVLELFCMLARGSWFELAATIILYNIAWHYQPTKIVKNPLSVVLWYGIEIPLFVTKLRVACFIM